MAHEIPVTQARAELADLINRVVYGGETVVLTRHGKPLVALVSADDLRTLDEFREREDGAAVSTVTPLSPLPSAPGERQRFGITAEYRGPETQ
ncbi:type II toxin-antitoxin system Phd/YefM family antitoxin [Streptomyces sp. NPDC002490]|uniref:type II toxin-antitoxin system Phd/YefM family antitoxin n=1 Tax=Streptomyces sp. NPDC002490 TaxID=3154416 RepID=UPI003326429E